MTTPNGSAADELRAYYGCRELAAVGLDAVPAYDQDGSPTGLVAIDPAEFSDWYADGIDDVEAADTDAADDCEQES